MIVEDRVVGGDVAHHQRLGEFALVLEVVEEAALGDAGARDQLIDGGRGKSFLQNGRFGNFQQAIAGIGALAQGPCEHGSILVVQ